MSANDGRDDAGRADGAPEAAASEITDDRPSSGAPPATDAKPEDAPQPEAVSSDQGSPSAPAEQPSADPAPPGQPSAAPAPPVQPSAAPAPAEQPSADPAPPVPEATEAGVEDLTDTEAPAAEGAEVQPPSQVPPATDTTPVEAPKPVPTPEWKVLEPTDPSDPVPHEVWDYQHVNEQWAIIAASVRGKLHAHKGIYREDAFQFGWTGDWTIVAVSDGAGSASKSRVAARVACDESVATMKELLCGSRLLPGKNTNPEESDLHRLRAFLVTGARRAQLAILREAHGRGCRPSDMHATLLLCVHTPWQDKSVVGAIQVGDGVVGVYCQDGSCTLVGVADHGDYSSETRFLTTPDIGLSFEGRVAFTVKKEMQCLAVMCDGVSDDFFPEDARLVELFVGNPIQEIQTEAGGPLEGLAHEVLKNPRQGQALAEWLRYEKRGSSDDRTLVAMFREPTW